jgi:preflagellin peptidase FlaK
MIPLFLFFLAFIWLFAATIEDVKKREIANWLNFSLIIFAIGFRFFYSLFMEKWSFFYNGVLGLLFFFVLANLLYYSRFFAGGDAKLFTALGAIIPFSNNLIENLTISFVFLTIFFIIGLIYTLTISFYLGFKNFRKIKKEFKKQFKKNKIFFYFILVFSLLIMILGFNFSEFIFWVGLLSFIFPYLFVYLKSIDESCLVKKIDTRNLSEGDWLYEDVNLGKKTIKRSWHGLTKKEINMIRKNYKKIKIKQGIPFTPTFLFSFIVFSFFY